jgi:hypothetical protein
MGLPNSVSRPQFPARNALPRNSPRSPVALSTSFDLGPLVMYDRQVGRLAGKIQYFVVITLCTHLLRSYASEAKPNLLDPVQPAQLTERR